MSKSTLVYSQIIERVAADGGLTLDLGSPQACEAARSRYYGWAARHRDAPKLRVSVRGCCVVFEAKGGDRLAQALEAA